MILHQRKNPSIGFQILMILLIGLGSLDVTPAVPPPHIDLRNFSGEILGHLKSLIFSYNQMDNKLERHEHRERALGEHMKKAMQSLQKGQKNLEPINGIFSRLDERVSQIETLLLVQEEKYNRQREKIDESLDRIYKWMQNNDECMKRPPVPPGGFAALMQQPPPPPPQPAAPAKPSITEEFMKKQYQINADLMSQLNALTSGVQQLIEFSQQMSVGPTEVIKTLTKLEDKLITYSEATPAPSIVPISNKEFEDSVLVKFDELSTGISELKAVPKPQEGLKNEDREYIQGLNNDTLNALELVKNVILNASDKGWSATSDQIKETKSDAESKFEKILEDVATSSSLVNRFYTEMNSSYEKMNDALEVFNKFNFILMGNSEHVLETQRKVEYGTFQIVQKLSDLMEKQKDDLLEMMKERFDTVDETLLNNKIEGMKNLSEVIDAEIGQVWRRIEIMGDEITASTELLRMVNGRNDAYVNSTLSSIDNMGTTFNKIDDRMLELTSNLNFLLGKLSVMSQEFQNIKIGLAESLDELRQAFKDIEDEVPKGPGPHYIANNNKYETHINQLKKRQTPTDPDSQQ